MMREILFRGKRKDNGEWVEGFFVKRIEPLTLIPKCYILVQEEDTSCITGEPTGRLNTEFSPYVVIPETISQYTGLKDKNGKRIFEGDIVQYYERQIGGEDVPIVQPVGFEEGGFGVYRYFLNNWLRDAINGNILLEEIEVIGNIHDNQELLEIK